MRTRLIALCACAAMATSCGKDKGGPETGVPQPEPKPQKSVLASTKRYYPGSTGTDTTAFYYQYHDDGSISAMQKVHSRYYPKSVKTDSFRMEYEGGKLLRINVKEYGGKEYLLYKEFFYDGDKLRLVKTPSKTTNGSPYMEIDSILYKNGMLHEIWELGVYPLRRNYRKLTWNGVNPAICYTATVLGESDTAWAQFETYAYDNKPAMKDALKDDFLWKLDVIDFALFGENNIATHHLADVGSYKGFTKKYEYHCNDAGQVTFRDEIENVNGSVFETKIRLELNYEMR